MIRNIKVFMVNFVMINNLLLFLERIKKYFIWSIIDLYHTFKH